MDRHGLHMMYRRYLDTLLINNKRTRLRKNNFCVNTLKTPERDRHVLLFSIDTCLITGPVIDACIMHIHVLTVYQNIVLN